MIEQNKKNNQKQRRTTSVGTLEQTEGSFGSLNQIERDIDRLTKEVHKIEIEELNRKWDKNLRDVADAVEGYVTKNFITTDEELEEIRKLITK